MVTYSVSLDLAAVWAEPDLCPVCGTATLARGRDDVGITYECERCGSFWCLRSGRLDRIDPTERSVLPEQSERSEEVDLPRQVQP